MKEVIAMMVGTELGHAKSPERVPHDDPQPE